MMSKESAEPQSKGTVLALDLGEKLIGAAVTDELQITIQRLKPLKRSSWKQLLLDVRTLVEHYDAKTLVIGLPLMLDGTKGSAAEEAERIASNFRRSLSTPVHLQDERLTSVEARALLIADGHRIEDLPELIDGEAARLILRDYLNSRAPKTPASDVNKEFKT